MRHDQTITQAPEGLDQVPRSLGPEPVQIKQDARVDGDHCLTKSSVELGRRSDLVANEILVIQPMHREILPVRGQASAPNIHISVSSGLCQQDKVTDR